MMKSKLSEMTWGAFTGASGTNGTRVEKVQHVLQPFSSTLALLLLGGAIIAIILLSLTTYHLHKSRMKKRRMQRAQEEFERDSCGSSAKPATRRCVITRPAPSTPPDPLTPPTTEHRERVTES